MVAYLLAGSLSLAIAPTPTTKVGEFDIPAGARCLRANRHADFTSVELNVGTPFSLLNVLVRLDHVVENTVNASTLRLFSSRVAESDTVSCHGSICADAALLQLGGPASNMERVVMQFAYTNPSNEILTYGTAVTLGLDGELAISKGYDYYLTATHFCWDSSNSTNATLAAASASDAPVRAHTSTGTLRTDASDLVTSPTMRNTPVGMAHAMGRCLNASGGIVGETGLFPGAAGDEATWLGFGSTRMYEESPDGVEDRRTVVEVGTDCAAAYEGYNRAYSLYTLDCQSVYTPCTTSPTVPMRRVASDELRILTDEDGAAFVWTYPNSRLTSLPRLEDATDAVLLSLFKLALMTLAAAIVWIRAAKTTSSHDRLFMFCVRSAHCEPSSDEPVTEATVWEDALIGLIAIGARLGVAVWRLETLADDNQSRAAVVQLVACGLSLAQWATRYFILQRQCETPLTKLGGSTALCDASSAVMLAFAQPPLLLSNVGRFDPTARLLTALLLTIVTLQRCLYASSCCGLLWAVARHDKELSTWKIAQARIRGGGVFANDQLEPRFSEAYEPILLAAAVGWVLQAASVGVLLADVFALPLAHSSARSLAGDWLPIAFAFFAAITVASMPQLVKTAEKIAEAPTRKEKKKDPDGDQWEVAKL